MFFFNFSRGFLWHHFFFTFYVQVLKQDSQLRSGLKKLESSSSPDPHDVTTLKEQVSSVALRKENLLKMIAMLESDVIVKEKEAAKASK